MIGWSCGVTRYDNHAVFFVGYIYLFFPGEGGGREGGVGWEAVGGGGRRWHE